MLKASAAVPCWIGRTSVGRGPAVGRGAFLVHYSSLRRGPEIPATRFPDPPNWASVTNSKGASGDNACAKGGNPDRSHRITTQP
jgi:hypothetical protein